MHIKQLKERYLHKGSSIAGGFHPTPKVATDLFSGYLILFYREGGNIMTISNKIIAGVVLLAMLFGGVTMAFVSGEGTIETLQLEPGDNAYNGVTTLEILDTNLNVIATMTSTDHATRIGAK
jgi:hypothetical protein